MWATSSATGLSLLLNFVLFLFVAQTCRAEIVDIAVGLRNGDLGLVFTPEVVYQNIGEQVRFQFYPLNHSVAQSSIDNPCAPLGGASSGAGFFSGFNSVPNINQQLPTFTINITSAEPIYFYCAQGRHCQSGMVGIINPPAANAIDAFRLAASKVSFSEIPLLPPTKDLPSPKFPTKSSTTIAGAATNPADPQYTPNTPLATPNPSSGGLSTSGYIAIACIGALVIIIAAVIGWCVVLRRRRRRAGGIRLDEERRQQRGKDVAPRGAQRYRDTEPEIMIGLETISGPSQANYAYSYRRPPAADPARHSAHLMQRPRSHISPNSMSSGSTRRLSANVNGNIIHLDHRPSTASVRHYNRMSMPHPSARMSIHAPSTFQSRPVQSRRHSTQSIPASHHRQSVLRKPSPEQQQVYNEESGRRKAEQKRVEQQRAEQQRIEQNRKSLTPGAGGSPSSPSIMPRWKIFKKSTYRRRMVVREIDIHDENRYKNSAGSRKPTPSIISRPAGASSGDATTERNLSTRTGTATTAVDSQTRGSTSHAANPKHISELMVRS